MRDLLLRLLLLTSGASGLGITQKTIQFGAETYTTNILHQARAEGWKSFAPSKKMTKEKTLTSAAPPPMVLIPPVGVGIDRNFYTRLQEEWAALGAPVAMHAPDLLGTGSAQPKPRRFYSPEVWAAQLDAYIGEEVGEPCTLVVQGGLLPCALDIWSRSGRERVAAVSCLSPPTTRFFEPEEEKGAGVEGKTTTTTTTTTTKKKTRRQGRGVQRATWAVACSPVGNGFYRRLRGPRRARGERTRQFTERNLFAAPADDQWVRQCVNGATDARNRFATFSYLCGSIPPGGAWRDDRGASFDSLDVPVQFLRGDFGGLENATARVRPLLDRAPNLARLSSTSTSGSSDGSSDGSSPYSCSAIVRGARQCLPWEQPKATAAMLALFYAEVFGTAAPKPPPGEGGMAAGGGAILLP